MKKTWMGAAAAAMVLMIGVTGATAFYGQQGSRYVDANGDGVCDNRTANWTDANGDGICDTCGWIDANGDGICDNRGANGQGAGYVDADGDGVCDNRAAGGGMMAGQRGGNGRCAGGNCRR